jgi:D-alanine-D-alanine ligase
MQPHLPAFLDTAPLVGRMRAAINQVDAAIQQITLVFVTNIRSDELVDVVSDGISNAAQHYSERQAETIIRSFQDAGFHVISYFEERDFLAEALSGELQKKSRRIPIVFPAAEGGSGPGRRALIPAFCAMVGLAYCNSTGHGCSVARHKFHANSILKRVGLPVPDSWMCRADGTWIGGRTPPLGTKVIVKPMYESMAIGISDSSVLVVDDAFDQFTAGRTQAFRQPVAVQQFVTGYEVGIPVLELDRPEALPVVTYTYEKNIRYGGRPRTFEDENLSDRVGLEFADYLPEAQYRALQYYAVLAFERPRCGQIARQHVNLFKHELQTQMEVSFFDGPRDPGLQKPDALFETVLCLQFRSTDRRHIISLGAHQHGFKLERAR